MTVTSWQKDKEKLSTQNVWLSKNCWKIFLVGKLSSIKMLNLGLKPAFWGNLRAKLELCASIIFFVGNLQLSIAKIAISCRASVFNARRRCECFDWSNDCLPVQLWLSDLEVLAVLLSALMHDFEHTGTTNAFHVNTRYIRTRTSLHRHGIIWYRRQRPNFTRFNHVRICCSTGCTANPQQKSATKCSKVLTDARFF